MVWCLCTKPLLSFSQEPCIGENTESLCVSYCIGADSLIKVLWKRNTTDSLIRYSPFERISKLERKAFLGVIMNYKSCCIKDKQKSKIISLFGKPDAKVADSTANYFYYFINHDTYNKYIQIRNKVFESNKALTVLRVSFDCKTQKAIDIDFK